VTTINFQEVRSWGERSGKCNVCGKHGKRSKTFTQTINLWNRNVKGEVKDYREIYDELTAERDKWAAEPFVHGKCES
jgi:hypothetical protein